MDEGGAVGDLDDDRGAVGDVGAVGAKRVRGAVEEGGEARVRVGEGPVPVGEGVGVGADGAEGLLVEVQEEAVPGEVAAVGEDVVGLQGEGGDEVVVAVADAGDEGEGGGGGLVGEAVEGVDVGGAFGFGHAAPEGGLAWVGWGGGG